MPPAIIDLQRIPRVTPHPIAAPWATLEQGSTVRSSAATAAMAWEPCPGCVSAAGSEKWGKFTPFLNSV